MNMKIFYWFNKMSPNYCRLPAELFSSSKPVSQIIQSRLAVAKMRIYFYLWHIHIQILGWTDGLCTNMLSYTFMAHMTCAIMNSRFVDLYCHSILQFLCTKFMLRPFFRRTIQ